MPLQNIQETIKKQAQEKVAEIEENTKKQIQKIEAEITQEKENLIKEIKEKTDSKIKNLKEQNKIASEMRCRNAILEKKLGLLTEARNNVVESLFKLNSTDYEKIIKKLLEKISLNSDAEIIIPPNRKEETQNVLKITGKNFRIKTDQILKGGFILRTDKFEINNSFVDIVKQIFEEKEMEIVNLLFSNQERANFK